MKRKRKLILSSFLIALTVLMVFSFVNFTFKSVEAAPTLTQWQCTNLAGGCMHRGRVQGGAWGPWVTFSNGQPSGYNWACKNMNPPHLGQQCGAVRVSNLPAVQNQFMSM